MNLFNQLVTVCISLLVATTSAGFVSYPRPSIYDKSAHFSLKVNGTYMYTVSYAGYDYVQLSMDEGHPTEFRIALTDQPSITSYNISPLRTPINAVVDGNELVFTVVKAHYLIVKINNEKEFIILVDPSETDVPSTTDGNVYNVLNYEADNTGATTTKGVQAALDAAEGHVGSIVYVPPGLYIVPNLHIHSQTSLYLAGGAVLRMSDDPDDYEHLFYKSGDGNGTWWIQTDFDSKDIKVYGRGTIDGNGQTLFHLSPRFIADLLVPVGTTNFKCDGILVRDASFWAVVPIQVTTASMTNMKILDRFNIGQNDGIDVVESTDVTINRAIAITNDDSFSTKTWPYNVGTTVPYPYSPRPLRNVVFDNCIAWTNCYGYKVGQGVYEDQDNVKFTNSVVYTAAVALGIDHRFGTSTASHISFTNMDIEGLHGTNFNHATWLAVFVELDGHGVGPIKDVVVNNVKARVLGQYNSLVQGYNSSAMVSGVTIGNVYVHDSTVPAKTLAEMKVVDTDYSEGIKIVNN